MQFSPPVVIASLDAARPVFLIVMGLALLIFTWRLAAGARTWPARLMVAGSLMLAFGYSVVLPGYEGGLIPRLGQPGLTDPASAQGWHLVMMVTMNLGWLVFGTGIALHAKIFPSPAPHGAAVQSSPRTNTPLPTHEPVL